MHTPPPEPPHSHEPTDFMAGLRQLKAWSGLSYRQLERSAAATGDWLPSSTTASMLGRDRLPREELLLTYLRACGLDPDAVRSWAAARHRAATPAPRPRSLTDLPRPARGRRWKRPAALLAAAAMAGVALWGVGGAANEVEELETTHVTQPR